MSVCVKVRKLGEAYVAGAPKVVIAIASERYEQRLSH